MPNIQSIGWMVSKVEGRGPIVPPLPLCLRVAFFYLIPSWVKLDDLLKTSPHSWKLQQRSCEYSSHVTSIDCRKKTKYKLVNSFNEIQTSNKVWPYQDCVSEMVFSWDSLKSYITNKWQMLMFGKHKRTWGDREGHSQSWLCEIISESLQLFIDWLTNGSVFPRRPH